MKEISSARGDGMFSVLATLDVRFAFQNVRDGFLQAVMMDARLRSGLDKKCSAPQRRVDAQIGRNRRAPQRTRRLRGSLAELLRINNADRQRIVFAHAQFDVQERARLQLAFRAQASACGG